MRGCQCAGFVLLHVTLSYIVASNSGDYSPPCLSSITSCASRALRTISDALLRCFCASCNTRSFIHTGSRIVIVVMGSGLLLYNLSPSHNVVVKVVGCACLACVYPLGPCPWDTMRISQVVLHVNPLAKLFSSPRHTTRSPHYHHAPRSAHTAISRRVTHPCGRQLNRYRRLENDLKKVCGKPSARKHGGRSYNIGE